MKKKDDIKLSKIEIFIFKSIDAFAYLMNWIQTVLSGFFIGAGIGLFFFILSPTLLFLLLALFSQSTD